MQIRTILVMILLGILPLKGICQFPQNIVPNFSFEDGGYSGLCSDYSNADKFDSDIASWYVTGSGPCGLFGLGTCRATCYWVKYSQCPNFVTFANGYQPTSDKYVQLLTTYDNVAGIRTALLQPLKGNSYYRIRMKIMSPGMGIPQPPPATPQYSDLYLNVEFSKSGDILYLGKFYAPKWDIKFHTVQKIFYVPLAYDGLNSIKIFYPTDDSDNSYIIDDIEVFEQCPELTLRQNLEYTIQGELEEGGDIQVGRNVTNLTSNGDVFIRTAAITNFKAYN